MKDKKGMEMTINTIIILIMGLVILAIGIYLVYTKILKPSESAGSVITCEARGGTVVSTCQNAPCAVCLNLPAQSAKGELRPCCIQQPVTS